MSGQVTVDYSLKMQIEQDVMLFGEGFVRRHPNGVEERIPPAEMSIHFNHHPVVIRPVEFDPGRDLHSPVPEGLCFDVWEPTGIVRGRANGRWFCTLPAGHAGEWHEAGDSHFWEVKWATGDAWAR